MDICCYSTVPSNVQRDIYSNGPTLFEKKQYANEGRPTNARNTRQQCMEPTNPTHHLGVDASASAFFLAPGPSNFAPILAPAQWIVSTRQRIKGNGAMLTP